MIYFVYILFLVLMLSIERNSARLRPVIRILIPIIYTLLIGFRGKYIGVDTENYYEHFYLFGQWGCDFVEPGFDWLNRVLYASGCNANMFFCVNAAISMLFVYFSLNRLGKEYTVPALCIYLLTFPFFVNGMRQGIACSIFLYAYKYIEERRFLPYLLLIILASLFHTSALLLLPLYILGNNIVFSEKLYVVVYILSFIGCFMDLSAYLPTLNLLGKDYSYYVENVHVASASSLGFIVTTALNIIVLLLMLRNDIFRRYPLLSNLVMISFVMKNLGFNLPIVGRITIYFSWFVYFIYPIIFKRRNLQLFNSYEITVGLVLIITCVLWINSVFSEANMLYPYYFYWESLI